MKKIFFFAMLLIIATTTFSQQTKPSPTITKQDYLKKSKSQKTAAWWLLGGGAALTVTGIAIDAGSAANALGTVYTTGEVSNTFAAGAVLAVIGGVAMIGSIPLFIASGRSKRKAMSISFKNELAPQLQGSSFVYRTVPSLSLKINL